MTRGIYPRPPLNERLLAGIEYDTNGGCWLWFRASVHGYGQVRENHTRTLLQAHRASWEVHNGQVPDGLCVLHRCDVPACVNPDHLFLGTQADNMADMKRKGRSTRRVR
jgi:Autographiviridae endonuclease